MSVIFVTLVVGLAALGPLLLRHAARDAAPAPARDDAPGAPLAEPWRWLIRCPVALFAGFILAGLMNEALGSIALWLGRHVELDRAGQAVALWPPTAVGQVAEVLFFATLALVATVWIDRRLLIPAGAAPSVAAPEAEPIAAVARGMAQLPSAAPASGEEGSGPGIARPAGRRSRSRRRSTRR